MALCSIQEIVIVFVCASSVLLSVSLLYGDDLSMEQSGQTLSRLGENSMKRYGIIIDAGSSGSRVRVFSWLHGSLETLQNVALPTMPECQDVEPGVSSYADNPEDAYSQLAPLMECAKATVPSAQAARTPVFLMGTAGLRLLETRQQTAILSRLARDMCSKVPFYCKPSHFKVISGSDEGKFLWLSINHILRNFVAGSDTVGVLDMGGASTQIASAAVAPARENDDSLSTVVVPDYIPTQYVYSKSVLGAGMTVSRQLVHLSLVEKAAEAQGGSNPSDEIRKIFDPCANAGYSTIADLTKAIAVRRISQTAQDWLGRSHKVNVTGSGDPEHCEQLARNLVQTIASCDGESILPQSPHILATHIVDSNSRWSNCSFGGALLPPLAARSFYSVSNYYYTARFFRLGETVSVGEFFDHARQLCSMKWSDITSVIDVEKSNDPVAEFCFRSFYLAVFLQKGLGFSTHDHVSLHFVGSLNNSPTDWTLGAMLAEAGQLPASLSAHTQSNLQNGSSMEHQLFGAHTYSAIALCLNLAVAALLIVNSKRRSSSSDPDGNSLGKSKMSPLQSRRPPLEMLPLMNQDIA